MSEKTETKTMSFFGHVAGIFVSPREAFKSIDQKPGWILPFLLICALTIGVVYLTMDIQAQDRIAGMKAMDASPERIAAMESQEDSPWRYLGLFFAPVVVGISYLLFAGVILFGGNVIMGGDASFKKVFSLVVWSSLISNLGGVLKAFLTVSKGTTRGVMTSLAILMPVPDLGQKPSMLYRFLSQFDLFVIWQILVMIVGVSVIYRFSTQKASTLILSLWGIGIVLSLVLGSLLGPNMMM